MATQRHINTFTGGMSQDKDPQLLESTTYLYALNARIVFNDNGTLTVQNAKGNKQVISLPSGYMPIGSEVANGQYLIVFSTNETNSEIGFITESFAGTFVYQTVFNDAYDPYGNLLNFTAAHQVRCSPNYENDDKIIAYWVDDYNEPRAFNIMAGKPYQWWTNPPTTYPTWYSVHSMATMLDVNHVIPQYNSTVAGGGQKYSGRYQYCYRLTHSNGYVTPYSPVTNLINLAQPAIDFYNWTNYYMGASGVLTNKAIVIDLVGLDTRFEKIELVCVYWETGTTPTNAYVCQTALITGANMQFTDTDNIGTDVPLTDITQTYTAISRAKTNSIFRDCYHLGNVVLNDKIDMDTTSCVGIPSIRNILSDTLTASPTAPPFTNQTPTPTSNNDYLRTIEYYGTNASNPTTYAAPIKDEYINYKGTQLATRFTGYFRGETYPFAIVLWDMKGMPMYASHIADIQFPSQYSTGTPVTANRKLGSIVYPNTYVDAWDSLSTGTITQITATQDTYKATKDAAGGYVVTDLQQTNTNEIPLQALGIIFNDLDLTHVIYDANGKQRVSGFQIVRMDSYGAIAFQGISQTVLNDNGTPAITVPIDSVQWTSLGDGKVYMRTFDSAYKLGTERASNYYQNVIVSPDLGFTSGNCLQSLSNPNLSVNNSYRLHTLGAVYGNGGGTGHARNLYYTPGTQVLYYSKPYLTSRIDASSGGSSNYYGNGQGAGSGISTNSYTIIGNTQLQTSAGASSGDLLGIQIYKDGHSINAADELTCISQWSLATGNQTADWNVYCNNHNTGTDYYAPVYPVINWELGIAPPAITTTELENRIYKNIGHFIPINQDLLTKCTDGSGNIIVNGIEVFGGDTYLDYYSTTRQIAYEIASNLTTARSVIAPLESRYNFTMREGNTFDKVGANASSSSPFTNGFYIDGSGYRTEDFAINSVLLAEDNWRLYYPKPNVPQVNNQPTLHYFSNTKTPNELIDSYRIFLPLNFDTVDGRFGEIIRMDLLFNDLYLLQTSGFNRARFKERAMVSTSIGDMYTATGEGLQGYDYVSKEFGLQNQFAFTKSGKAFYWIDAYKGKFIKFSQQGVELPADVAGFHNYIATKSKNYWNIPKTYFDGTTTFDVGQYTTPEWSYVDNASGITAIPTNKQVGVGGINLAYDYKNDSVLINFSDVILNLNTSGTFIKTAQLATAETIEYNEVLNKFTSYHELYPNILMPFKSRVLMNYSPMQSGDYAKNTLWLHDEGVRGQLFGANKTTVLRFAVNPQLGLTKYFDNGRLNVNGNAVSLLSQVIASTQNLPSQTIVLNNSVVDNRPIWLEGELRYPIMQKSQVQRLRDKYVILEFTITNDGSDTVVDVTSHETLWRPSAKI